MQQMQAAHQWLHPPPIPLLHPQVPTQQQPDQMLQKKLFLQGGVVYSVIQRYEGDTPEVGGVLALCTENATKKLTLDIFREKLATYINKNLTHATNVVRIVKHLKDLKGGFDKNNKPDKMTKDKLKLSMN